MASTLLEVGLADCAFVAEPWTLAPPADEAPARRALRTQIARLELQLAELVASSFPAGGLTTASPVMGRPVARMLDLAAFASARDTLADQVAEARAELAARAEREEAARDLLERMLLAPGEHKWARLHRSAVGEPGCGAYEVRPRMGFIGMFAGWWHVKLSSGCPLAGGLRASAGPPR